MISITQLQPEPGQLAYYRTSWVGAEDGYSPITWYEVDHDGCVLRLIEVFLDGRVRRDTMANYPDGASDYGFGTLIGVDFYDQAQVMFAWPTPDGREAVITLDATRGEFEAIWERRGP